MTKSKIISAALAAIIVAGGMAMAVLQEQPELAKLDEVHEAHQALDLRED